LRDDRRDVVHVRQRVERRLTGCGHLISPLYSPRLTSTTDRPQKTALNAAETHYGHAGRAFLEKLTYIYIRLSPNILFLSHCYLFRATTLRPTGGMQGALASTISPAG
jgi:hypothetical protein